MVVTDPYKTVHKSTNNKSTSADFFLSTKREELLIIYLSRVLCLSVCDSVCVSQFVAERSAILLVLAIKLTKETRQRVWRGSDRGGEIGKRQIVEGGCEETFHC